MYIHFLTDKFKHWPNCFSVFDHFMGLAPKGLMFDDHRGSGS